MWLKSALHLARGAAVDDEDMAVDERCGGGGEKHRRAANLVGPPPTTQWRTPLEIGRPSRIVATFGRKPDKPI
jgi:hypothetical protein